jgi:hypothetical protein
MPDGAERGERADPDPGLFGELPTGGLLGEFPGFDASSRELPKTREQSGGRTLLDQPSALALEDHDGSSDVRSRSGSASSRHRPGIGQLPARTARERHGTVCAVRPARSTDRLPELHDRLVELSRVRPGQDGGERVRKAPADGRDAEVPFLSGPAGRDPEAVRLEGHVRPAERDGRDRPGDVRADSGKALELGNGGGKPPSPLVHDLAGRRMEMVSAAVVAGALPELQYPGPRRAGERLDGRELAHKPLEVRGGQGDPRLLKEHLCDPDPVRVPVGAPRKRASMGAVPSEECRDERGRDRRGNPRGGSTHGAQRLDEAET